MAKTKKERVSVKAEKKVNIKYGLDLGQMIHEYISNHPTWTQTEISDIIKIGRQGMSHRLRNPSYGTCYDIIEISILLQKDFITPMLEVIKNNGVYEPVRYSIEEVERLKADVALYKDLYERQKREVDLLHKVAEGKS
ncbi:MAG: hypothetical protein HOP11_03460 [Saprospiraceae bacterium]|nr:hypothetical protein [Saprospiraceae bacterium]